MIVPEEVHNHYRLGYKVGSKDNETIIHIFPS